MQFAPLETNDEGLRQGSMKQASSLLGPTLTVRFAVSNFT
jgi:hypothetical protein